MHVDGLEVVAGCVEGRLLESRHHHWPPGRVASRISLMSRAYLFISRSLECSDSLEAGRRAVLPAAVPCCRIIVVLYLRVIFGLAQIPHGFGRGSHDEPQAD